MAHVFELTFDPATEAIVRGVWQRIADAGLPSSLDAPGYRPHISLAVYDIEQFDVDICQQRAQAFARGVSPFTIRLSHLGVFTSWEHVVFLGVAPSTTLLTCHQEVLDLCHILQPTLREYYAPGQWTPHVTLAFDLHEEQAQQVLATVREIELPISGMIQALHLVEVTPEYARDVFTCEFGT